MRRGCGVTFRQVILLLRYSMLSIQFLHFSKFARCDDEVLVFMLQLKPALRLVVIGHVLSLCDLFHLVHITARHAMTQYMSCHSIYSRRYLLER